VAERFRNKYRSGSARLYGYDYSRKGAYFVTICTRTKIPCLGKIVDERMILSEIGIIVKGYWMEIQEHFRNIYLDEFVIMPDHLHGIIIIKQKTELNSDSLQIEIPKLDVSIEQPVEPEKSSRHNDVEISKLGDTIHQPVEPEKLSRPYDAETPNLGVSTGVKTGNPYWKSNSIGSIINQFKRICTIKTRMAGLDFTWQPRFYDHVIRSHTELEFIRNYIRNNVANWNIDDHHVNSIDM
jgi:hypothetical protein